jgi:uncharacterized SAM-binding protein YcdF (DUF218 family)
MTYILSKVLLFLLNPAFWLLVLLLFLYFSKNSRIKRRVLGLGLLVFLIFSNGWLFDLVIRNYESDYPPLKKYKYGLLMGGFSGLNRQGQLNFNRSGDRLFQTLNLYRTGKIQKIVLSSGNADLFTDLPKEADLAAAYLREIGVPDSDVLIENRSRNTKENLQFSKLYLAKNEPVLVITSAWHIPRVKLIAKSIGLNNFTYYPSNSWQKGHLSWNDYVVPSIIVMDSWSLLFKELIGCLVVKLGIQ